MNLYNLSISNPNQMNQLMDLIDWFDWIYQKNKQNHSDPLDKAPKYSNKFSRGSEACDCKWAYLTQVIWKNPYPNSTNKQPMSSSSNSRERGWWWASCVCHHQSRWMQKENGGWRNKCWIQEKSDKSFSQANQLHEI